MTHPMIDRQDNKFILHDIDSGYHVEITLQDLARLARQASMWIELDMICDVLPKGREPQTVRYTVDYSVKPLSWPA